MKTFEEWLEEFKKEVVKGYNDTTMVTALCGHVYSDREKPPTSLYMLDGPPTASTMFKGAPLVTLNFKSRSVKPLDAGFVLDLKDWADDTGQMAIGEIMDQLGKDLADREYWIIVNGMITFAGNTVNAKQKGLLSKDDIKEAQRQVLGTYADSAIMNPVQEAEFWKNEQMLAPEQVLSGYVPKERRGYYYTGMIDGVNVYIASFIRDFALVFSRREMIFASTSLALSFDNMAHPKKLILRKLCASAPMFDGAIAKNPTLNIFLALSYSLIAEMISVKIFVLSIKKAILASL